MPEIIEQYSSSREVATERELLNFANKIRKAGGADILDSLLPSIREDSMSCLVATAVNFQSEVIPWMPAKEPHRVLNKYWRDGSEKWLMIPQRGNQDDCNKLARELAKKLKLRLLRQSLGGKPVEYAYGVLLPKHISNAAQAFDYQVAFQQYDQDRKVW